MIRKLMSMALVVVLTGSSLAMAADKLSAPKPETTAIDAEHLAKAQKLINEGVTFLLSQRDDDGGWSMKAGDKSVHKPALTAKVLVQHPDFGPAHAEVKKGFEAMLKFRQADGGIYNPQEGYGNYNTSLAVMALSAANQPQYAEALRDAVKYLRGQQIVAGAESPDGVKVDEKHPFYGGVSYGKHGRPDLSNVGMWMEAMKEAGVSADDEAMKRALVFVSRCQNSSETNDMAFAKEGGNDRGFVYAPSTRDGAVESKANDGDRGLRSYGSMTYVGFKSMLYAGVDKADPRVQGAFNWIRRYWRFDSNPNMPSTRSRQGLYYYYHVLAKALRAWGQDEIKDADGKVHNWRHDLIAALAERVRKDGSWTNDADRWSEGSPTLVTCYSVLALQEAMKK